MAPRLAAPVLTVDAGKMHHIDTRNVENLHSMWTGAVEEGRRLENLSWRIWNRETFCCDHQNHDISELDRTRLQPCQQHSSRLLPELSTSVDSAASDDIESRMIRSRQYSPPLTIHRLDSSRSSLSGLGSSARERHISSFALERMVMSIKERKDPKEALPAHVVEAIPTATASAPPSIFTHPVNQAPIYVAPVIVNTATYEVRRTDDMRSSRSSDSTAPLSSASSALSRGSRRVDSDTSTESVPPSMHAVVRGFTPNKASSYRSSPKTTAPIPARSLATENKKKGLFTLGGSRSSGEEENSLDSRMTANSRIILPQKSSLTSQLKRNPNEPKKQTSFKDVVQERTFTDEDVFESSDEDDDEEDGAIEDDSEAEENDDAEDWESGSESETEDQKPPVFKRIDSKANLTSRRSLLTTMMHESDRAAAMQKMASQLHPSKSQPQLQRTGRTRTTSPLAANAPSGLQQALRSGEQQTAPKPIISPTSSSALALSPKTTRRNMLAAELTESLRTHLLHERAMKNNTLAASKRGIIRRHTAQGNLSELERYPRSDMRGANDDDGTIDETEPWQRGIFGQGAIGEYHERGW